MYSLGAGRILIKSVIIVCSLNLMAWKASCAHRTGENENKDNDKKKQLVQTSSACGTITIFSKSKFSRYITIFYGCATRFVSDLV